MPTLKDTLCLLSILLAYGIVGQMDYEDAVRLEGAQKSILPVGVECVAVTNSLAEQHTTLGHPIPPDPQTDPMIDQRAVTADSCPVFVF